MVFACECVCVCLRVSVFVSVCVVLPLLLLAGHGIDSNRTGPLWACKRLAWVVPMWPVVPVLAVLVLPPVRGVHAAPLLGARLLF